MEFKHVRPDESVNISPHNPLFEFLKYLFAIGILCCGIYFSLGFFSDRIAILIPASFENIISENAITQVLTTIATKKNDTQVEAYQKYIDSLVLKLPADTYEPYDKISIHVVNSDEPNAFAFFGGHIILTTGLFGSVKTENGLMFVIGHELGHLHHRHVMRSMGRGIIFLCMQMFLSSAEVGSSDFSSYLMIPTQLVHSRSQEREADEWGVIVLNKLYGHSEGANEFFEYLLKNEGESALESVLSSHPIPSDRIEALRVLSGIQENNGENPLIEIPKNLKNN